MKCPKCGGDEFEVKANTYDSITVLCCIDNGEIEYLESNDECVSDTEYYGNAVCDNCGCNIEIATGKILEPEVELRPYSVLLLYPEIEYESGIETYYDHVFAEDVDAAIEMAKAHAMAANPEMPDEFGLLGVWSGHIEQERGAVF